MTDELTGSMVGVLERGSFCHVAVSTPNGPHVTPTVFAFSGNRVWITTSRGSVKTRAWRRDPRVACLVRDGDRAVSFTGRVETYDLLDTESWGRGLRDTPALGVASLRFTRKNARFFAGYAVDAKDVPLAWTPPGRVFVGIRIERAVLLDGWTMREVCGTWKRGITSRDRFRTSRTGRDPFADLPDEVRETLGSQGAGTLAVEGGGGPVVLPTSWASDGKALYATLSRDVLALTDGGAPAVPVALAVDHPSWWRAKEMAGAMVQGTGSVFALGGLASGERSARAKAELTGVEVRGQALVVVVPSRVVWWRGWSSGTVMVA